MERPCKKSKELGGETVLKTTISMIPIRRNNNELEVLMQQRLNSNIKEWSLTWEFPQGKLEKRPDLTLVEFMKYKFNSETGMTLVSILRSPGHWIVLDDNQQIQSFIPVVVTSEGVELGIHLFVKGEGDLQNTLHASGHKWIPVSGLAGFIENHVTCPLNKVAIDIILKLYNEKQLDEYTFN